MRLIIASSVTLSESDASFVKFDVSFFQCSIHIPCDKAGTMDIPNARIVNITMDTCRKQNNLILINVEYYYQLLVQFNSYVIREIKKAFVKVYF